MLALGEAYLGFVAANPKRWYAVFELRLPEGGRIPDWHLAEHLDLFRHVAGPLREIDPDLGADETLLLGRSIWSAVHGIVSLGLEDRMARIPVPVLSRHVALVVGAFVDGYAPGRGHDAVSAS